MHYLNAICIHRDIYYWSPGMLHTENDWVKNWPIAQWVQSPISNNNYSDTTTRAQLVVIFIISCNKKVTLQNHRLAHLVLSDIITHSQLLRRSKLWVWWKVVLFYLWPSNSVSMFSFSSPCLSASLSSSRLFTLLFSFSLFPLCALVWAKAAAA